MRERLIRLNERTGIATWRLRGHAGKIRAAGIGRVTTEDLGRAAARARKLRWRLRHDSRPDARPVFIVGLQRSGTKMLMFALNRSPEVQIYNENKRSVAFDHFQLRDDATIRALVEKSPHRCVAFKALCDSHRVADLLERLGTPTPGRAIWIYRSMEGRVRSAVARFGDNNLGVLRALAAGSTELPWQGGGLNPDLQAVISQFDYTTMTPESAAALWWYVRNSLFFDLKLNERDDITLTSYDRFLADPQGMMRSICSFVGISYDARLTADIGARRAPMSGDLEIDARVRELCCELELRLDDWFESHGARPAVAAA